LESFQHRGQPLYAADHKEGAEVTRGHIRAEEIVAQTTIALSRLRSSEASQPSILCCPRRPAGPAAVGCITAMGAMPKMRR
jgi:hypothetical protein